MFPLPAKAAPSWKLPAADLLQTEVTEVLGRLNLSVGGKLVPLDFALLQYSGLSDQVFPERCPIC